MSVRLDEGQARLVLEFLEYHGFGGEPDEDEVLEIFMSGVSA